MKRLIVNADDLGVNASRSHGIFQAFQEGIVRSASLYPNGGHSDTAAKWARERGLSCGLHLNLTEEFPLSDPKDVATLLNPSGMFFGPDEFRRVVAEGGIDPVHVERELRAQMEWCLEHYGQPSHVNGHHHIHLDPIVINALLPILDRYGVRFVRINCEVPLPPHGYEVPPERLSEIERINKQALAARELYEANGIGSTDHFRGMTLKGRASKKNLRHILSRLPEGSTELLVHPGSMAAYGTPFDLDPQRQTELNMVCDEELPGMLSELKIELGSFEDL